MPAPEKNGPRRAADGASTERLEMYKLAYAESARALDFQGKQLEGARQRTVQYLAFIGTATAFLVGTSLSGADRDPAFYSVAAIGTVAAITSVALAGRVLLLLSRFHWKLPRLQWSFAMSGKRLVEWIEPEVGAPSEADYVRALTLLNSEAYEQNESALRSLSRSYTVFVLLGFFQLAVWVVLAWLKG